MSAVECTRLQGQGLLGKARLSCQCKVEGNIHLKPWKTLSNSEYEDPGSAPAEDITPEPEWVPLEELAV